MALVTGGSRGIGRAIAISLARINYDVMINYAANEAAAAETKATCEAVGSGVRIELCRGDVSQSVDRDRLLRETQDRYGRIDLLVNNAGIAPEQRSDLLESGEEGFDRLIGVNLKGPYFLSQAVARWMIELKAGAQVDNYHPAIINISSVSAFAASPARGDYCISKAGMAMMTKLFAARLADEGINVYEIRPGVISTDMTANVKAKYDAMIADGLTPIRRWGEPEDVARAVAAIALGSFPFSTGEVINVDGGFHLRLL